MNDRLKELGVSGIVRQMAERGQIVELRCEMPNCYCPRGRGYFEPRANPMPDWALNPDHYPIAKARGGHLRADNVRLAHVRCNNRDHGWRSKINAMLAKEMSLEEIAAALTRRKVPTPHGTPLWTAKLVRKSFVS